MGTKHLTDIDIQEYLDGIGIVSRSDTETHLQFCSECRERVEEYECLYDGLGREDGFELSADFAAKVIDRVANEASAPFWQRYFDSIVAAAGLILTLATVAYFVDLTSLARAIVQFIPLASFTQSPLAMEAKNAITSSGGFVLLLVSGILAITAVWAVDRFVIHSRKRISSFLV